MPVYNGPLLFPEKNTRYQARQRWRILWRIVLFYREGCTCPSRVPRFTTWSQIIIYYHLACISNYHWMSTGAADSNKAITSVRILYIQPMRLILVTDHHSYSHPSTDSYWIQACSYWERRRIILWDHKVLGIRAEICTIQHRGVFPSSYCRFTWRTMMTPTTRLIATRTPKPESTNQLILVQSLCIGAASRSSYSVRTATNEVTYQLHMVNIRYKPRHLHMHSLNNPATTRLNFYRSATSQ